MTELEVLKQRIQTLEEAMEKMQVCAIVIKKVVQDDTGIDIDKKMEEAMKGE